MPADGTLQTWQPLPFDEAVQFWRSKVRLKPGQFTKLREDAQVRAFAVSGVARDDVLATMFEAIEKALAAGTSYSEFRRDIRTIIEKRGWTGRRAWRVETIFRTTIQTAYNVGKYAIFKEGQAELPYWQYDAVGDSRTRPSHAALNGKIFRADDPFWDTWYPPNGFNCRCTVRALSQAEVRARGLQPIENSRAFLDAGFEDEAGRHRQFVPDPGFAHHPGKIVFGGLKPKKTKSRVPRNLDHLPGPEKYRKRAARNLRPSELDEFPAEDLLPSGLPESAYWDAFHEAFGFGPGEEKVLRDKTGAPVILSDELFLDAGGQPKIKKRGRERYVKILPKVLLDPDEIWITPMQYEDGRIVLRRRYVKVWRTPNKQRIAGVLVLEVENGRWVGITTFRPEQDLEYLDGKPGDPESQARAFRRGLRIYGK